MVRDQVFISYSHRDDQYFEELQTQLKPYLRTGVITAWTDQQIAPGSEWFGEIKDALDKTVAAVMLVSPAFLASDFIHEHELGPLLKEAEAGGVKILWVLIRDCSYEETPLNKYQAVAPVNKAFALMSEAERDTAWKKVCHRIMKAVTNDKKAVTSGSEPPPTPPPFPSYSDIVNDLREGIVVPVLGPSVNTRIYSELASHLVRVLVKRDYPRDLNVTEEKEKEYVKAYYGSPCPICHFLPRSVPPGCPLLEGVPEDVGDEQELSVAKTNCRNLSRLYETRTDTETLYSYLADCILKSSKDDNGIYLVLARLLNDWQKICDRCNIPLRDRKSLPFPFIITSNFDAGLERVFEEAGIPYDLVWLVAAESEESNRGKWLYLGYGAEGRVILPRPGTEASGKGPAFPFGRGTDARVTIIKVFGSFKDPSPSCRRISDHMLKEDGYYLITQDQMEAFFSDQVDNLPNELVNKIRSKRLLFLGFSPNDPDLRAIVDRLYGKERMPKQYWILHRCVPGKLDQEIWKSRGDVTLVRLTDSLKQTMLDLEAGVRDDF